ncbi:hypothetical protein AB0L06_17550 [Spirillospora sp. NPDC052269]
MSAVDIARALPSIAEVRALSQSFAVLDAVLSGNGYGSYDFVRTWRPGLELASMETGGGDDYSIVFTPDGALILGFDHESEMSPYGNDGYEVWPGLVDEVPDDFAELLAEPEFCHHGGTELFLAATVCLWRRHDDPAWRTGDIAFPPGNDPDGASWLFELLAAGTPEAYSAYAGYGVEAAMKTATIRAVLEHRPLTSDLAERLNPEADLRVLAERLEAIGYPSALGR